jgi:uncharacterized membrane protein YbhN (UPF0104 family)
VRNAARLLAGLGLSALAFALFFRHLDVGRVAASLEGASVPLLLVTIVFGYVAHLSLRALRWRTMLDPLKPRIAFYHLFSTTAIGYAVSCLTPGGSARSQGRCCSRGGRASRPPA